MEGENNVVHNDSISFKEQEWKSEHETILVEWADKAMCYRWLHAKSHQAYSKTNAWFTIPVIVMSTLTGTANFGMDRIPEDVRGYAQMGIGAVNLFAGILTTIAQFLKVSELNEAHRVSSIAWDKFYRNIKVELAKSRDERMHVGHMLKMCKEEFDRLMETSPSINENIISLFNKTFPSKEPMKQLDPNDVCFKEKADIKRPEICDSLTSTADFVFQTKPDDQPSGSSLMNMVKLNQKKIMDSYENEVYQWCNKFIEKHNRKPLESEIIDNLHDKMNPDILNKMIIIVLEKINKENEISVEDIV